MIAAMHFVLASGFSPSLLDLGQAPSALGVTVALLLTFVVAIGGLANFLIAYTVGQVLGEREQNLERQRAYDAAHGK